MIKRYNTFVNENMDMAKSIVAKKMEAFDKLKTLLSKNMGYIGKFTEYLMNDNITYDQLVILYDQLVDLKKKNTTVDFTSLKYEKALDDIQKRYNELDVKGLVNQFPATQKEIARKMVTDNGRFNYNTYFNTFLTASKKPNIDVFLSKVSRYKDSNSLYDALKIFCKDASNDKEHVKATLTKLNSKSKVVFENDNFLIVYVESESDIKELASDTSWCIVHSGMWNTYNKTRDQYILYDYTKDEFDPKFKLGITIAKDLTIYAAHDILDKDVKNTIDDLFKENGIDKSQFLPDVYEEFDISKINSKTKLDAISDYVELCRPEDYKKLLSRLFDVFGGRAKDLTELTYNKEKILKTLIEKIFKKYSIVTEQMCDEIDPRLAKYAKHKISKILYKTDIRWNLSDENLSYALDIWEDQALVYGVSGLYRSYLISGFPDFTKPLKDEDFGYGRKVLTKLSDRLNKIYKEKKVKMYQNESYQNSHFAKIMFILNCLLNRKNIAPDKDILEPKVKQETQFNYPGLFGPIDLSDKRMYFTSFSSAECKIPFDLVVKKDYTNKDGIVFDLHGFKNVIPSLLKRLEGHKIALSITKKDMLNIIDKVKNLKVDNIDKYQTEVYNVLNKFPKRLVINTTKVSDDGNISVTLKD